MAAPLFPLIAEEVADLIKQLYPPGTFYDWESRFGDPYKWLMGLGDFFLEHGYGMVARIWREVSPGTVVDKIPDWETTLGLAATFAAQRGTTEQRRSGILGKLRESGAFTIINAASVFAIVLGYETGVEPRIYETDRAALRSLHTYWSWSMGSDDEWAAAQRVKPTDGANVWTDVMAGNGNWCDQTWPADGGVVPRGGVILDVKLAASAAVATPIDIRLSAPNGVSKTWTMSPATTSRTAYRLYAANEFVGCGVAGKWKLEMRDSVTDGREVTLYAAQLFVEGMADGLADATVEWGPFADPDLMGTSGIPAQLGLAKATVKRLQHSHTDGSVLLDDTIPDACIPA